MKLSHTDEEGRARMVNVGEKPIQHRIAVAEGFIHLQTDTLKLIQENQIRKGDVLTVAQVAGIQAGKQTGGLIPLCHPLTLSAVDVTFRIEDDGVRIFAEASCVGQTGVEMEALTAVSVAALTIYDMCKAVDKRMIIDSIQLKKKEKHDLP